MKHSIKSINPSQLQSGEAGKFMVEIIKSAIKEAKPKNMLKVRKVTSADKTR